ncbi:MAG: amidohydrolase [Alphaproteobacteria bacterium]|nr:amidohydrolase [Alphaproteobacteria bacterium]
MLLPSAARAVGAPMPIFDAHIHFSHDAADRFSAGEAVAILEKAGLKRALVSSSGDAGTRALHAAAPDLVLPSLRPYRRRGEIHSWIDDSSVIDFLEDRLKRFKWVAVGEFHLFASQTDKAVPRRMIELARQHNLLLHAHSDAGAVDGIFAQWPEARVLWAHAGFVDPDIVGPMLGKHANLWTDLAFRSEHAYGGRVDDDWRSLFADFPDRVMVGTDTFTPERWHYVVEHADWTRQWLTDLPPDLAEKIAWRNGEAMIRPHLAQLR